MSLSQTNYTPHLEWEAIEFPLVLKNLKFEQTAFAFDDQATITLWRADDLQLKGRLVGRIKDPKATDEVQFVGKGNIIRQETIIGDDTHGNQVFVAGCVFGAYQTNNYTHNENGYLLDMELIFDTLKIVFVSGTNGDNNTDLKYFEWCLIEDIRPDFWGTTSRSLKSTPKKARVGIDDFDEENLNFVGRSLSRDYFALDLPELKCIVAEVPKELIGNGMKGLCLEFRGDAIKKADKIFLADLRYFLSFLLGARLYYMGYSKVKDWELAEAFADSPDIPIKLQVALPPIQYNRQYDWGNFALQANQLFIKYRELQNKLFLNHAIDRFWIANETPVGVNLPILAGAMEIVAGGYLKMTDNDQLEYLSKTVYETLIGQELSQLKTKLTEIEGGDIILNKIKGAFRKGPNEKMSLFFQLLALDMGKAEKEAINLRNKMTHSKRDYSADETAYDDVVLTRVYQVLFYRVLLKLMGYTGYYIDYSLNGCPLKPLSMKAGEVDNKLTRDERTI